MQLVGYVWLFRLPFDVYIIKATVCEQNTYEVKIEREEVDKRRL